MKAISILEMIFAIVLTIMGSVITITAITTAAGLDSIVVGALFTLCGIVGILNSIFNLNRIKRMNKE